MVTKKSPASRSIIGKTLPLSQTQSVRRQAVTARPNALSGMKPKRPTLGMYPGVNGGAIKRRPMKAAPAMKRRALSRMK